MIEKLLLLLKTHMLYSEAYNILSFYKTNLAFSDFFEKKIEEFEKINKEIENQKNSENLNDSLKNNHSISEDKYFSFSYSHIRTHALISTSTKQINENLKNISTELSISTRLQGKLSNFNFSDYSVYFQKNIAIENDIKKIELILNIDIRGFNKTKKYFIKISFNSFNVVESISFNNITIGNNLSIKLDGKSINCLQRHIDFYNHSNDKNCLEIVNNYNDYYNNQYPIKDLDIMFLFGGLDYSYKDDIEILQLQEDNKKIFYYEPNKTKNVFELIS